MKRQLFVILFAMTLCFAATAHASDKLKVVATLPSFAAIAASVGGDYVDASSIGAARFNPHFIEPKPSDVLRLKRADLYIHSGLDLEAWSGPLIDASARAELRRGGERQLDLSQGIALLEVPIGQVSRAEGDIHLFGNPHYWLDPRNGLVMAATIARKLQELDPAHSADYRKNLATFSSALQTKIAEWQNITAPYKGAYLVGYHNEWVYLMAFTGLKMERFLEPKPGIPPSPGQITSIIEYVKSQNVRAIVQPSFYPTEAANKVAQRTGAKVVLACQNTGELPGTSDYVSMFDYDIKKIVEALRNV